SKLLSVGVAPHDLSVVEREVFGALPLRRTEHKTLTLLAERVKTTYANSADKLHADGLVFTSGGATGGGLLTALPLAAVLALFGVPRLLLALTNNKDAGYLMATFIIGLIVCVTILVLRPFRTRKGDEALARLKAGHAHLAAGRQWDETSDAG